MFRSALQKKFALQSPACWCHGVQGTPKQGAGVGQWGGRHVCLLCVFHRQAGMSMGGLSLFFGGGCWRSSCASTSGPGMARPGLQSSQ